MTNEHENTSDTNPGPVDNPAFSECKFLRKLDDVLREVQFQNLVTRGYESVQRITNIYERLQRLSEVKGQDEREREAKAIKVAVLDINSGILISLKTVSDVLTGKDQLGK